MIRPASIRDLPVQAFQGMLAEALKSVTDDASICTSGDNGIDKAYWRASWIPASVNVETKTEFCRVTGNSPFPTPCPRQFMCNLSYVRPLSNPERNAKGLGGHLYRVLACRNQNGKMLRPPSLPNLTC